MANTPFLTSATVQSSFDRWTMQSKATGWVYMDGPKGQKAAGDPPPERTHWSSFLRTSPVRNPYVHWLVLTLGAALVGAAALALTQRAAVVGNGIYFENLLTGNKVYCEGPVCLPVKANS